jgi:hypothetical protein
MKFLQHIFGAKADKRDDAVETITLSELVNELFYKTDRNVSLRLPGKPRTEPRTYPLNFPQEWFVGQGVNHHIPFYPQLKKTIEDKYPHLKKAANEKNSQYLERISEAGGSRVESIANMSFSALDNIALTLLIHLENRDTMGLVRRYFPYRYKSALDAQGGQLKPMDFTVKLLEEFGVEERDFPSCFGALRAKILSNKYIIPENSP